MNVYVVLRSLEYPYGHGFQYVDQVFSSEDLANKYIDHELERLIKGEPNKYSYFVEEHWLTTALGEVRE
jgi:hypothetical protein